MLLIHAVIKYHFVSEPKNVIKNNISYNFNVKNKNVQTI